MDYWLSKFMFDLKDPELLAEFRCDPEGVIDRYPLRPEIRRAALDGDVPTLLPLVNAYLLRFYFAYRGMKDDEFVPLVRAIAR